MLIPCQSPIWCPFQWCIADMLPVLLMFFCYGALWCAQPPADHFAQVVIHLLPPICSSSQLFIAASNTWVYLNFFLVFFFPLFYFSYSEEIPWFLVNIFKDLLWNKFTFPNTHTKYFTKTAVLSHCPSMSCSYLVLPCLSESICCPVS